jgi:hypothetical protein
LLISTRRRELGITTAEIARRVGYRNIGKGVRRINELCQGDFRAAQFIVAALPRALELPHDDVRRAVTATEDELDARERARLEAEDRGYRSAFRPHAVWVTERLIPRPIFVAAFLGVENLLRFDLDMEQGEETFVAQAIAANPSWVSAFGKVVGFHVNYTPDRCVEYDAQGNVPPLIRIGASNSLQGRNAASTPKVHHQPSCARVGGSLNTRVCCSTLRSCSRPARTAFLACLTEFSVRKPRNKGWVERRG